MTWGDAGASGRRPAPLWRDERGAGAIEWLGGVVAATLVLVGLTFAAPGLAQDVVRHVDRAVCTVAQPLGAGPCAPGDSISGGEAAADPYVDRRWTRAEVTRGSLVFLGDSYGAGEGAKDYDPATDEDGDTSWWEDAWGADDPPPKNMCHRSANAAYHATSDNWFGGENSTFASCSGARTADYWEETQGNSEEPQRDALDENTSLVVVSMGGNDMEFANVLKSCIPQKTGCMEEWDEPSAPGELSPYEQNLLDLFGEEPGGGELGEVYADIRSRTGDNAHVVIVGYPLLFDDDYGGSLSLLTHEQAQWMNGKGAELNDRLRQHAEHYGFTFIDPSEAFADHGIGSDDPWILTFGFWGGHRAQPPESYHPTADGQAAIAELVDEHLRGLR